MAVPYTNDEVKDLFIKHVVDMVEYWSTTQTNNPSVEDRLSGLAFSILAAIDGSSLAIPGFILAPDPHPEDAEYAADEGMEKFFPETPPVATDIGGSLHERYHAIKSGEVKVEAHRRF